MLFLRDVAKMYTQPSNKTLKSLKHRLYITIKKTNQPK